MKTGKYLPLGYYRDVKVGYGTVDFKNLKTVYLKFNSWVLPRIDDDYNQIINKSRKKIKHYFLNRRSEIFKKESIVDLDIKTKGVKLNKKSFMNLEITLYVNKDFDFKCTDLKNDVKTIIKSVIDEHLTDKNLFNFYKHKKTV